MKPPHERLNDQLEQATARNKHNGLHPHDFLSSTSGVEHDPEIDGLVALARRLQTAPQLEATSDFTKQLQRRVLHRYTELKLIQPKKKILLFSLLYAHPVVSTVLGICLLFCVLSTSILAIAAQVSNPNNPLYSFKLLEQHFQSTLAGNPDQQAVLDLQFAQDRLNTLSGLADPSHAGEYRQALTELDQRITTATSDINALPASTQRTQLLGQLARLKSDAIQDLHSLLSKLALPEHLATTGELAQLGDNVPHLVSATLTLPARPNGSATIAFSGSDIQPGAQLLVDSKLLKDSGTFKNGQLIFVIAWHGDQHAQMLGILNPDGTAIQIKASVIKTTDDNKNGDDGNKNSNGSGNSNGNGNSNSNGNKPTTTPTPRH